MGRRLRSFEFGEPAFDSVKRLLETREEEEKEERVEVNEVEKEEFGEEEGVDSKLNDVDSEEPDPSLSRKVWGLPVMSSLSESMRRRINRVPRPDSSELERIEYFTSEFSDTSDLYESIKHQRKSPAKFANLESCLNQLEVQVEKKKKRRDRKRRKPVHRRQEGSKETSERTIAEIILEAQSFLPEAALFQHRLKKYMKHREIDMEKKLHKMFVRFANRVQASAWDVWVSKNAQLKTIEAEACAKVLQKQWFRFSNRKELQEQQKCLEAKNDILQKGLRQKIDRRKKAAVSIQTAWKSYVRKIEMSAMVRFSRALKCIQHKWRTWKFATGSSQTLGDVHQALKEKRERFGATSFQKLCRGWLGRKRAHLQFRIELVRKHQEFKERMKRKSHEALIRQGAAFLLQQWWKGLCMLRVTRKIFRKRKEEAATRIQAFGKGSVARARFKDAIAEKRRRETEKNKAAILLQARFRTRYAQLQTQIKLEAAKEMMKMRSIQREKRLKAPPKGGRKIFLEFKRQLNPFHAEREHWTAVQIQSHFRGKQARKRVRRQQALQKSTLRTMRRNNVRNAAIAMQARWRGIQERRKLQKMFESNSATRIQAFLRQVRCRREFVQSLRRHKAAKRIQAHWRGSSVRQWTKPFQLQIKQKHKAVKICQFLVKRFLAKRNRKREIDLQRFWEEQREVGNLEAFQAQKRVEGEIFIHSSFMLGQQANGPLQNLYRDLVRPNLRVSQEKFLKLLKSCAIGASMMGGDSSKGGIVFASSKESFEEGLNFSGFRKALISVAQEIFLGRKILELVQTKKSELQVATESAVKLVRGDPIKARAIRQQHRHKGKKVFAETCEEIMASFEFRHFKGTHALLLRFFEEYAWKSPLVRYSHDCLLTLVKEKMEWAAIKVQQNFRGSASRNLLERFRIEKKHMQDSELRNLSATRIQAFWRMLMGKSHLVQSLKKIIQQCIDPKTGEPFWFNTLTQESRWTKPRLLGANDVDVLKFLPSKEEEFVVKCSICQGSAADKVCINCEDVFCNVCFESEHWIQNGHIWKEIEPCSDCEYQAATRYCKTCSKSFCCTCFENHHRNSIEQHKWSPIVKLCCECEKRATKWKCEGCDGDIFCSGCLKKLHQRGNRVLHEFFPIPFYIEEIAVLEKRRIASNLRRRELEEEESKRKAKEAERLSKAAVFIQCRWRGRKCREVTSRMLCQHRLKLRQELFAMRKIEEENRKAFAGIRNALKASINKIKSLPCRIGLSPPEREALPGPVKTKSGKPELKVPPKWRERVCVGDLF